MERYLRQTVLPQIGAEGQKRLLEARVLVVGLGGLGCAAAAYLAGAGTGVIGLCDNDTVSLSNLQRQVLYSEADDGLPKCDIAAQRLGALNSEITLRKHPDGLTAENAAATVGAYGLVVDCTDNHAARYIIDDACAAAGIPWVYGAIGVFGGRVAVFNGKAGCRYADLYPERDALCMSPRSESGVLGALPGVIGAIEASEAIKILAGFGDCLDGRLFVINLLTLETETIDI